MPKCKTCGRNQAEWAWQTFGPGETPETYTTLGSHYRGFPVIKICDECKEHLYSGCLKFFTYKDKHYIATKSEVAEVSEPPQWRKLWLK